MAEIQATTINPNYIISRASLPSSGDFIGQLCLVTSTNNAYIWDGSTWNSTGLSGMQSGIVNISPNMFAQEAVFRMKGTSTGYDNLFVDNFATAAGTNSTVNTTSTTAHYNSSTKLYSTGENSPYTGTGSSTVTSMTISGTVNKNNLFLSSINAYNNNNPTSGTLTVTITKNGTTVATKSIVTTGSATFNFLSSDYSALFNSGDTMAITIAGTAGSANLYGNGNINYPCTSVTFTNQPSQNLSGAYLQFSVVNGTSFIETNALSIPSNTLNPNWFLIYPNETLLGSSTITANVSFDGGSTYMTNVTINTPYQITTTNTNSIVAKINLNTDSSGLDAKCDAWAIVWGKNS